MVTVPLKPVVADVCQLATPKGVISSFKNIRDMIFICDFHSSFKICHVKVGYTTAYCLVLTITQLVNKENNAYFGIVLFNVKIDLAKSS